jgi:hypothetical protein
MYVGCDFVGKRRKYGFLRSKKKAAFPHPSNDSIEQCPEPSCNVPKPSRTISSMSHVVPPPKKKQETLV